MYSIQCFLAMNILLKNKVSTDVCFFECQKIRAEFRYIRNSVANLHVAESPVWSASTNALIISPIPCCSKYISLSYFLQLCIICSIDRVAPILLFKELSSIVGSVGSKATSMFFFSNKKVYYCTNFPDVQISATLTGLHHWKFKTNINSTKLYHPLVDSL